MASILRVLAVVFLLVLPAGPSAAAPVEATVEPHLGSLTLAPGGPDKLTLLWMQATGTPQTSHHFAMTVDYAAVAGFADVEVLLGSLSVESYRAAADDVQTSPATSSGPCTQTTATMFTCGWDGVLYKSDSLYAAGLVSAKPKSTAVTGDEGKITVTARIDDGTPATTESTVRVGEGVDLASGSDQEVSAKAGGTANTTPVVRNSGTTAVNGLVMFLDADPRLLGTSSYSNCEYGEGSVVCTFDTVLAVGQSYALSDPISLGPPAGSVPGSQAQAVVQWLTATEWQDLSESLPDDFLGEAGTGDPLELTEAVAGQDQPQSDVEPENDAGTITLTVTGGESPDLAALGARVTGTPAADLVISVGTVNLGPGTLHPDLYPNNQVAAQIRLPANVTALDVDPRCRENGTLYLCYATATMAPGDGDTYGFVVRLDASRGEAGQVQVDDLLPTVAGIRAANQENNVAPIVVTASGGTGGGLPITGSTVRLQDVLGMAATGAAFIVVGTLLTVRRDRRPVGAHAVRSTGRGRRRKGTPR